MRRVRRIFTSLLLTGIVGVLGAGAVSAHSQIVTPPAHEGAVVDGPISNAWAQAHCNAASPAIVAERSNGVVRFVPGAALPCPAVENPGGQVHP